MSDPACPDDEILPRRAHSEIPGGAHTGSRGDDPFRGNASVFICPGQGTSQ